MRYGIPAHRLPREVLDAEIDNLKRYGITIHTNSKVGKDITLHELREHGAKAVFIASGAWKGLELGIQGEEAEGVRDVTAFLQEVHLGETKSVKGRVVVVGGGHSALDGARVALRLGADEVHIIYRRSPSEMLAEPEEVSEAEEEEHFQVLRAEADQWLIEWELQDRERLGLSLDVAQVKDERPRKLKLRKGRGQLKELRTPRTI